MESIRDIDSNKDIESNMPISPKSSEWRNKVPRWSKSMVALSFLTASVFFFIGAFGYYFYPNNKYSNLLYFLCSIAFLFGALLEVCTLLFC